MDFPFPAVHAFGLPPAAVKLAVERDDNEAVPGGLRPARTGWRRKRHRGRGARAALLSLALCIAVAVCGSATGVEKPLWPLRVASAAVVAYCFPCSIGTGVMMLAPAVL